MKKTIITALTVVFFSSILFAGSFSFKGYFPSVPKYEGTIREKTDSFDNSGIALAQKKYIHEKRDNWVLVSYTAGTSTTGKSSMPMGFNMSRNGVIIKVLKLNGYICFYTYYTMEKKGTIVYFMPQNQRQKYNGQVTFLFTNTPKGKADKFMKYFNLKKIQKRMEALR